MILIKEPYPFKDALNKFVSQAMQAYPNELLQIILFGSLARGEEREDSDINILVIVNEESIKLRRNLIGIGFDIQLETSIDLSIKVVSEDEFKT